MTAFAAAQGALQRLLQRLVAAVPVAWRHDPLFRGASIGAGVTLALLMLRLAGPHDRALERPATVLRYVPGAGVQTRSAPAIPAAPPPPGELPKIAPGQPLSGLMVHPVPDPDRFGTFAPAKHP